ncbi:hypothetical protein ACHAWF_016475 [Thalassiosira exigua]
MCKLFPMRLLFALTFFFFGGVGSLCATNLGLGRCWTCARPLWTAFRPTAARPSSLGGGSACAPSPALASASCMSWMPRMRAPSSCRTCPFAFGPETCCSQLAALEYPVVMIAVVIDVSLWDLELDDEIESSVDYGKEEEIFHIGPSAIIQSWLGWISIEGDVHSESFWEIVRCSSIPIWQHPHLHESNEAHKNVRCLIAH